MVPDAARLVFLYGSREVLWTGIAPGLLGETGAIRGALMRCEQLVRKRLGWSLLAVFASQQFDNEQLRDPSLTALQIALTEGWRERGVQPDIVAARSGGEFAAEFARGTIALEDAMEVACRISGFIRAGRGAGRMLAIRAGLSATQHLERSSPVRFSIVADADDDVTILACETNAIEPFQRFLIVHQIDYRVLASAIAPHGPLIDEWKSDLLKPLSGGTSHSALVPYYSAGAQGRDDTGCYSARLWRAVREPALVGRMLDSLIADGGNIFLEIGGQPMLAPRIQRRAAAAGKEVVTLPRQRSDSLPALMDESEDILRKSRVFSAAARSGSIADRARTPTSLDRSQGARQR